VRAIFRAGITVIIWGQKQAVMGLDDSKSRGFLVGGMDSPSELPRLWFSPFFPADGYARRNGERAVAFYSTQGGRCSVLTQYVAVCVGLFGELDNPDRADLMLPTTAAATTPVWKTE
jgi:hypothetical protein